MPKVFIAGATGSVGGQAIEVVSQLPGYTIHGISCLSSKEKLQKISKKYKCKYAAVAPDEFEMKVIIKECDIVINAVSGFAGLNVTLFTLEMGKELCLANKESLVVAGHLVMPLAKKNKIKIRPIDSEHNAIAQCMEDNEIEKVWITSSGGALRDLSIEAFKKATINKVLDHPVWKMGRAITVDSATMFNKALEILEAKWLFGLSKSQIIPVIHRESIVHSMVEYVDGTIQANLSRPDMRLTIQNGLTSPKRIKTEQKLTITDLSKLTFEPVDQLKYRSIKLAYDIFDKAESFGTVLNSSKEIANMLFLNGMIKFDQIFVLVEHAIQNHTGIDKPSLEQIVDIHHSTALSVTKEYMNEQDFVLLFDNVYIKNDATFAYDADTIKEIFINGEPGEKRTGKKTSKVTFKHKGRKMDIEMYEQPYIIKVINLK